MKHIVLCYDRQDAATQRRILTTLRAQGLDIWTDDALEPETTAWKTAIEQAIEDAAALVVLMSPAAKQSEWIDREIAYANANKVLICPVLIAGDEASAIPFELIDWQWIDVRKSDRPVTDILAPCLQHHLSTLSTSPNYLRLDADTICKTPYAVCTGSDTRGAVTIERATVGQLAQTFGFTLEELELNRKGEISEEQRQRLHARVKVFFTFAGTMVIPLVYFGYQLLAKDLASGTPALRIVLVLVFVALQITAIYFFDKSVKGMAEKVETVTGPLTPVGTTRTTAFVRVGDKALPFPSHHWEGVAPTYAGQYRAYYTNGVYLLLSLEPWTGTE
jgi:hypothetical protein